ncbi:MAG: hypothetical protein ACOC2U_04745 [bacterium]
MKGLEEYIKSTYEQFFQKTSGNPSFEFNLTKSTRKNLDNFLKRIPEGAGKEWVFDFLLFQFSRYHDKKTKMGRGVVPFSWLVGQKAFDAWNNRTERQVWYSHKFKLDYGITKEVDYNVNLSPEYKDSIRKRFFNTEKGFVFCKENFLKREKGNRYCLRCNFKKVCDGV